MGLAIGNPQDLAGEGAQACDDPLAIAACNAGVRPAEPATRSMSSLSIAR